MVEITYTIHLERITCCSCGILFAVPDDWRAERLRDHQRFHCPNGHGQHFTAETEAEKYKRELAESERKRIALRAETDQAHAAARNELAARLAVESERDRLKKRVKAGVCPCCKRTFKQLAAHMKHKHPTLPEQAVRAARGKA